MTRIVKRAGIEPWPKLFQNLRSTRETELFKLTNGNVEAVCSWIGNSPVVAMTHYAQVTEADLKDAAKLTVMNDAEKAVHNPVQNPAVSPCTEPHESLDPIDVTPCHCGPNQKNATACDNMQNPHNWALQDSNTNSQTPQSKEVSNSEDKGAVRDPVHVGALSEDALSQTPHDLKKIITGWARLPEHVRQAIVTLVASVTVTAREGDEVV